MSEVRLLPSKIVLPQKPWQMNEQLAQEERKQFESYLQALERQEETGTVESSIVLNTLFAAWTLRRKLWYFNKDPAFKDRILRTREIAKKYGYTKLWDATYYATLQLRFEKLSERVGEKLTTRHQCGRCGREIWNPLSVKRGIGPVCWHKRGS